MTQDALIRADRVCRLLDIYGGLLTDLQRRYCEQHFAEDLSFGEIAREQNISRQAVHDTVKNALALLDNYEAHLKLLAQEEGKGSEGAGSEAAGESGRSDHSTGSMGQETAGQAGAAGGISPRRLEAAREALADLSREIRQRGGVIYDGHAVARQLDDIEDLLAPEE